MLVFNQKIFDDVLSGTTKIYTSPSWNELLGSADRLVLHALVDSVSGTTPTLTIDIEQAGDGRDFALRSVLPGLTAVALGSTATNSAVGWEQGVVPSAPSVRATLTLSGTTPSAHIELWATGRAGKRPFAPADLQGIAVWLTADSGITRLGSSVSSWADQSGAGLFTAVTQATPANQPAYVSNLSTLAGRPALQFTGSAPSSLVSSAFPALLAQPGTVFIVGYSTLNSGVQQTLDGLTVTHRWAMGELAPLPLLYAGAVVNAGTDLLSPTISTGLLNGVSSTLRLNGDAVTASGDAGSESLDGLTIGMGYNGASALTGYIAEVIVFSRLLSMFEVRLVEAYLSAKYGINLRLAAGDHSVVGDQLGARYVCVSACSGPLDWGGAGSGRRSGEGEVSLGRRKRARRPTQRHQIQKPPGLR